MLRGWPRCAASCLAFLLCLAAPAFTETQKRFHYSVSPNVTVVVANQSGPVAIKAAANGQVNVVAVVHSDRVEIDAAQHDNRVELSTHPLQNSSPRESRVDYDIEIPADATVDVRDDSGPVLIDGIHGAVSIETDAAQVSATNLQDARLQVRTLSGPVLLSNIHHADVEVVSVSGQVSMNQTDGNSVSVNTTSGAIDCTGTFAGAGSYSLTTHTGNITVTLPSDVFVDLSARSVKGTVDNELPLQAKSRDSLPIATQRSYAGTSVPVGTPSAAMPSLTLRSFSGKIRVKKQ